MTVASPVYGYIGTPPCWRRYSRLTWKQGPCHLVEEVFNSQNVANLFKLGPHYMGSLQAPQLPGKKILILNFIYSIFILLNKTCFNINYRFRAITFTCIRRKSSFWIKC